MTERRDRRVIQCNTTAAGTIAVKGARAYVVRDNPGGGNDRIVILLRSRAGRWVQIWQDIRYLTDFRVKTLPPEHPLYGDERLWEYQPDAMAARLNEARAQALA